MQNDYLKETYFFDYRSPEIQNIISDFRFYTKHKQIEQLYLYIRDNWRYNPYHIGLANEHFKSSYIASKTEAHCIDKAILYISGLRALKIPARLRLAKVSNHIAAERLEQKLGSNHIAPHGLAEVYFNNQWVKCSPAFNKELCQMYKVAPLNFNGSQDSVFQEYNSDNAKFMEYIEDYGSFADVPMVFIKHTFKSNYPELYQKYEGKSEIKI